MDTVDTCELGVSIDTSTKYRYIVFDTQPALFIVIARMYENPKKMSMKAKKKLINTTFSLEVCLMELDQRKIINYVLDRILHSYPKPFWKRQCVTVKMCYKAQTYWYRY